MTQLIFLNAMAVAYVATFAKGLATRGMVPVESYGEFVNIQLIISYGILMQLGVFNALNYLLPRQVYQGDRQETVRDVGSAMGYIAILSGFVMLCVGMLWVIAPFGPGRLAVSATCIALLLSLWVGIAENVLRGYQNFASLARLAIAREVTILAASVGCVAVLGARGLYVGVLAGMTAAAVMASPVLRGYSPHLNASNLKRLIRTGLPMFISGVISTLVLLSAQTVAMLRLAAREVGELSFGLLIYGAVLVVPSALSQIVYPTLLVVASGPQPEHAIAEYYHRRMKYYVVALLGGAQLASIGTFVLLHSALPQYGNGLGASLILAAILPIIGTANIHCIAMIAMGHATAVTVRSALALCVGVATSWWLAGPWGISGVAIGVLAAAVSLNVATSVYIRHKMSPVDSTAVLVRVAIAIVLLMPVEWALTGDAWLGLAASVVLAGAGLGVAALLPCKATARGGAA